MSESEPLDETAVRAAFMANHHPDAEPSSVELANMRKSISAYLAASPAPEAAPAEPVGAASHRHKTRGSEYVLLGFGKMQARRWFEGFWDEDCQVHAGSNVDMNDVAIYRSVDDGSLWARPREEFEDGRFETLTVTSRREDADTERLLQIAKAIDDLGWHNSAHQVSNAAHTINSLHKTEQKLPEDAYIELITEINELREKHATALDALARIERWFGEFPETGEYWDKEKTRPISYGAQNGSNGERDFMRAIARAALSPPAEAKAVTHQELMDREYFAFNALKGAKKHYCPDWDYMAIDEHSPEFEACTCYAEAKGAGHE